MLLLVGLATALPVLGEGSQLLSLEVLGTDQQVTAEWVGQGTLTLENQANAWKGEIHTEPLRFLQLRLWEGQKSLWEGTVPLSDQRAEILSFRVLDQSPNHPRMAERVAAAGPLPQVKGMEGGGVFATVWAGFLLVWLGFGLRLKKEGGGTGT